MSRAFSFIRSWAEFMRRLGADTSQVLPDFSEELLPQLQIADLRYRSPVHHGSRAWIAGTAPAVAAEFAGLKIIAGRTGCWVRGLANRNTAGQAALYLGDVVTPWHTLFADPGMTTDAPDFEDFMVFGQSSGGGMAFGTVVQQGSAVGPILGHVGASFPIISQFAGDILQDGLFLPPFQLLYFLNLTANATQGYQCMIEEPDA